MLNLQKSRIKQYKEELQKSRFLYSPLDNVPLENMEVQEQITWLVLAPGLVDFIIWTLNKAVQAGMRRLYFLARDGYFMYRTAQYLCEQLSVPIECRYLCCSRYSLRIPFFHLNMEEALEYICRGGIDDTIVKILVRSGISEEEQREVLKQLKIPFEKNESIPYAALSEIRKALQECEFFMECMYQNSKKSFPDLEGYLCQEGLLDNEKAALVDSGWVGSMQKTLNQVLSTMGKSESLEGYYWGLYELPKDVNPKAYHCYYFSPRNGLKEKVYFSNCLFETIFSAPHGMTLSYKKKGREYVPEFAEYDEIRCGFMQKTEAYLMQYIKKYTDTVKEVDSEELTSQLYVIKRLYKYFMGNPTKEEAEVFGSLEFSDDVLEGHKQPVAMVLNEAELRANHVLNKMLVMFGLRKQYIKESAWYEGSAARYGRHEKWHLFQFRIYKYLLYIRKYFS